MDHVQPSRSAIAFYSLEDLARDARCPWPQFMRQFRAPGTRRMRPDAGKANKKSFRLTVCYLNEPGPGIGYAFHVIGSFAVTKAVFKDVAFPTQ
jgi:hypothetical protein